MQALEKGDPVTRVKTGVSADILEGLGKAVLYEMRSSTLIAYNKLDPLIAAAAAEAAAAAAADGGASRARRRSDNGQEAAGGAASAGGEGDAEEEEEEEEEGHGAQGGAAPVLPRLSVRQQKQRDTTKQYVAKVMRRGGSD